MYSAVMTVKTAINNTIVSHVRNAKHHDGTEMGWMQLKPLSSFHKWTAQTSSLSRYKHYFQHFCPRDYTILDILQVDVQRRHLFWNLQIFVYEQNQKSIRKWKQWLNAVEKQNGDDIWHPFLWTPCNINVR